MQHAGQPYDMNMKTHSEDVHTLQQHGGDVAVKAYFDGLHIPKLDPTEYKWQQLTLHCVALAVSKLVCANMSFVVELYMQLVGSETKEKAIDFRKLEANSFLFNFFGEIERGFTHKGWRSELNESLPLLRLLALLRCDKAMVITLRCGCDEQLARNVRSILLAAATHCSIEDPSSEEYRRVPDEQTIMSELYLSLPVGTRQPGYLLYLLKELEFQLHGLFALQIDDGLKMRLILDVIQ